MSRLCTGLPGAGKTAFTLHEFLQVKDRPKYATHINGFDYEKHGVIKLEHFKDWVNCPDRSLIMVDEAQQYVPQRNPREPVPEWLKPMETHRHRAIDIWFTTQNPMFIDIHLRRLLKQHWHYFRPFDMKQVSLLKWNKVQDDPENRLNKFTAQKSRQTLPKEIFNEYTSTVEDTYKPQPPKKLLLIPVFAVLFLFCMWLGINAIFGDKDKPQQTAGTQTEEKGLLDKLPNVMPDLSAPAQAIGSSEDRPLSVNDFKPVTETAPWSAPFYREIAKPVTMPKFAGCMRAFHKNKNKEICRCVTQQGTTLNVDMQICASVVDDDGMPFDPFRQEIQQQQLASVDESLKKNINPPN